MADKNKAFQWFKNGDHPLDESKVITPQGDIYFKEGKIVKYFPYSKTNRKISCLICNKKMIEHGILKNSTGEFTVCPGDYILEANREFFVIKKNIFK